MRKIFFVVLLSFLILVLTGCGTYIRVKVLKPAEVYFGSNIKKIAVLDFSLDHKYNWGIKEKLDNKLRKAMIEKLLGVKTGKDEPKHYTGKAVTSKLINKLVENGSFQVIERDQLDKIMKEQQLSQTGLIAESDANRIGKLLGADALIIANGEYNVKDVMDVKKYKTKKGIEKTKYQLKRTVSGNLNYRVFNVSSGVIVASKTIKKSTKEYETQETPDKAREKITYWKDLVDNVYDKILTKLVQQIAPHYVMESRKIQEGSGEVKSMKAAADAAKRELWADAVDIWEEISKGSGYKIEDIAAATYNLGIYYEINGDLDKAFDLFGEAYKKTGETLYLDSKARIKQRKKELEKLREQQSDDAS